MTTLVNPDQKPRIPDSEIDPRKVIDANWDSETPGTEPWRIVTVDPKNGVEKVHAAGHDLGLAVALGYHRLAAQIHDDHAHAAERAAKADQDAKDLADFKLWKQHRDDPEAAARAEAAAAEQKAKDDEFADFLAHRGQYAPSE
jgi:hypothetical protein